MCLKFFLPSQTSMSMVTKTHKEKKIFVYYRKNQVMTLCLFLLQMESCYRNAFKVILDAETLLPLKLYSHCWHREPATSILPLNDFYIVVSYGLLSYTLEGAILICKLRSRTKT